MRKAIAKGGIKLALHLLDLEHTFTRKYTHSRWEEEMLGIAHATGTSIKRWRRFNLIPELTRAACSLAGFWGQATDTN